MIRQIHTCTAQGEKGIFSTGIRSFTLLLLPLCLHSHSFSLPTLSLSLLPLYHSPSSLPTLSLPTLSLPLLSLSHSSSLTLSFTPSSLPTPSLPTLLLPLCPFPLSHSPSSSQMHSLFQFSYYHSLSTLPSLLSKSSLSLTPFLSPSLNASKHSNSIRCYLSFMN